MLGLDPARQGLDVRRRTGYVPESPVLYDWMTVAEIGWFAAGFHLDAHGTTSGIPVSLYRADSRFRPSRDEEDQGPLQRNAGEGFAVPGAGVGSRLS